MENKSNTNPSNSPSPDLRNTAPVAGQPGFQPANPSATKPVDVNQPKVTPGTTTNDSGKPAVDSSIKS